MPIYEFYCRRCHLLLNFFSSAVDTESQPHCPRCGSGPLERRPARFATLKRRPGDGDPALGELDEERLEGMMESMAEELGEMGEDDDPRQLAGAFRRLSEASGLHPGGKLDELLGRLEAGEDPESLESEMEEVMEDDDASAELFQLRRKVAARRRRPLTDDTLYFL